MSFKSVPAACRLGRVAMLAFLLTAAAGAALLFLLDALPGPAAVLAGITLLLAALPLLLAWTAVARRDEAADPPADNEPDGGIDLGSAARAESEAGSGGTVLLPVLASKLQLLCGLMRELNRGAHATAAAPVDPAGKEDAPQPAEAGAAAVAEAEAPPVSEPVAAEGPAASAIAPPPPEDGRVDAAVREMETIAATVDRAALQIKQLLSELHRVSSIAAVIGEVAIQAELLALNAAMEAARSGGRSRALAAAAVSARELTQRAGATTTRIEQTIRAIQVEAGGAESAIAQVGRQVRRGVELVQGNAEGGREAVSAPAADAEPASSASIAEQMERIAQIVEGSSASMRSAAAATAELERLAQSLSETIAAFRA